MNEVIKTFNAEKVGNCKDCVFSEIKISTDYDNIKRIHVLCYAKPLPENITLYVGKANKPNKDVLNDFNHGCGMFRREN